MKENTQKKNSQIMSTVTNLAQYIFLFLVLATFTLGAYKFGYQKGVDDTWAVVPDLPVSIMAPLGGETQLFYTPITCHPLRNTGECSSMLEEKYADLVGAFNNYCNKQIAQVQATRQPVVVQRILTPPPQLPTFTNCTALPGAFSGVNVNCTQY